MLYMIVGNLTRIPSGTSFKTRLNDGRLFVNIYTALLTKNLSCIEFYLFHSDKVTREKERERPEEDSGKINYGENVSILYKD